MLNNLPAGQLAPSRGLLLQSLELGLRWGDSNLLLVRVEQISRRLRRPHRLLIGNLSRLLELPALLVIQGLDMDGTVLFLEISLLGILKIHLLVLISCLFERVGVAEVSFELNLFPLSLEFALLRAVPNLLLEVYLAE